MINNVTRFLDARKVKYRTYELPGEKLGAEETARLLGVNPMFVYKTIVVSRERGKPILALIPGPHRVDLKLLASEVGEKKLKLPTEHEAEKMTGLLAGGISPLMLLNKGFQVVIAAEATEGTTDTLEAAGVEIHISGGQRGLNICLPVKSLAEITHARFAKISIPEDG